MHNRSSGAGDVNTLVGRLADFFVTSRRDRNDLPERAFTSFKFAQQLLVPHYRAGIVAIARDQDDHRKILVDQRVRTMLHLAGGLALGIDVENFL